MSEQPSKPSYAGKFLSGIAIIAVLTVGGLAGAYIMSVEKVVPKSGHGGGGHGGDDGHGHEEKILVKLNATQLKNANLTIERASQTTIREVLPLNGIIQPNEERVVAVLPRFGGIVRSLSKRIGETVKQGEVVARIESNESLTQYDVVAPIGGTVIERKSTLGEYADKDRRLMVIADLSTLWGDFRVYQQDFPKLQLGQKITIRQSQNGTAKTSEISYISPIGQTDTQSMLARAVIDNSEGVFRPGLYVTGRVQVSEQSVPVAIKQSAIQYINSKPVVFVEGKEGFEGREVEVGFKDDEMMEILFGVVAGEKVVTGNSFVLRAEVGKGEATHEH
ncbi:efflux RND transporter periplasmic adaptor subunit [Hyphomicrobium sp. CS1BSMeth3]|uniref:efflux RND transporter periplasmic adaptor subunit n=1 Tax=Hyphomicrobium sp. CS1BSMeth3 TaxID=1892844 RepID=UPI000930B7AC|nr:efflux RND transporter periplasmic adaptor subunit [Hyphomicrobium sp. CS1BSMeth3]